MAKRKRILKQNNKDKVVSRTKKHPAKQRQDKIRRRKNFFPMLLVILISWGGVISIIYFVEPYSLGAVIALFVTTFIALFFTSSVLFVNTRRALIASVGLILFMLLMYLGIGNILNLLLIGGVAISIDIYASRG